MLRLLAMQPAAEPPRSSPEHHHINDHEEVADVPVQLVGGGTWKSAGAMHLGDRSMGGLSPAAPDDETEADTTADAVQPSGQLHKLPYSAASQAHTGQPLGLLGTTTSQPRLPQPSTGRRAAAALTRLPLARMGSDVGLTESPSEHQSADSICAAGADMAMSVPGGWEAGQSWGQVGLADWGSLVPQPDQEPLNANTTDIANTVKGSTGAQSIRSLLASSLHQPSRQRESSSAGAAAASVRSANQSKKTYASAAAATSGAETTSNNSSAVSAAVALGEVVRQGTAAFKASTRAKANRAGRFSTAAHGDLPGPGQFRPLHTAGDKHVPGVSMCPPSRGWGTVRAKPATATEGGAMAGHMLGQGRSKQQQQQAGQVQLQQQQCCQVASIAAGYRTSAGYRLSVAATDVGRRSSICTAGTTPRSAADEQVVDMAQGGEPSPKSLAGKQQPQPPQQQQQQQQQGTAAFKAVSRDQRAAVAAGRAFVNRRVTASDGHGQQREQGCSAAAHPVCPTPEFFKQISRPAPGAPTSSPAALGPGAYFRSGGLPDSLTGKSLLAGHDPDAAATDFGRASSRQGSSAVACSRSSLRPGTAAVRRSGLLEELTGVSNRRPVSAVQFTGQLADEPGMWAWAAADRACCRTAQQEGASMQFLAPGQAGSRLSCGGSRSRPSSAALAYVRGQRGTVLLPPEADADDDAWLMSDRGHTASPSSHMQQRQQQQVLQQLHRPSTVGPHQAAASAAAAQHRGRPFSAGPLLSGAQPGRRPHSSSRRPGLHPHSATGRGSSPVLQLPQHRRSIVQTAPAQQHSPAPNANSSRMHGLGIAEQERFNSAGFAHRVKGGKFSEVSRKSAAAAAEPALTELLYEPNPEVQGHMHRAPGWSLPPNRVASSKKWARLAAQAALQ